MNTYLDLITTNGQIIRIECPRKHEDELFDTIDNARKCNDWWSPAQFDGCTASFNGHRLERVNMGQVIGTL